MQFTRLSFTTDGQGHETVDHACLSAHLDRVRGQKVCHVCGHREQRALRSWIGNLYLCRNDDACTRRYGRLPQHPTQQPQIRVAA